MRFAFKLKQLEIGQDKNLRPITSCVVEEAVTPTSESRQEKLNANQATYLRLLQDSMPHGLSSDEWNEKGRAAGLDFKRRATFTDLKNALKDRRLVHETQGRWFITTR